MSKIMPAVALAVLVGSMPVAFAKDPHQSSPRQANQGQEFIQPDQMRASKMIGSRVYDLQNRNIGKVNDLIVNRQGNIDSVIVDVGSFLGMGGKNVAVKPSDFKTDNNRLTLDVTKEQLQQKADFNLRDRDTGAGTSASPVHGGKIGSGR
jgi:sporulation protein YlmC with PRC-barrel domain